MIIAKMDDNQKSLKEAAVELAKIKGHVKGSVLDTHAAYVRLKEGVAGLSKVEEKMKELGYPINLNEISPMKMYPVYLGLLILLAAKEIFNWTDDDIVEMGRAEAKYSFFLKLMARYFISPRQSYKATPKYWKRNWDFGELEAPEYNEKEKYCVIRIKKYKTHPVACPHLTGYFITLAQMFLHGQNISVKEVKCIHRGDPYHEWIIRWE